MRKLKNYIDKGDKKMKDSEKLLWEAYHKLLSVQMEDKEENEVQKKVLNQILARTLVLLKKHCGD